MSQVGTIKQYHDGVTYSLADVYDEKLSTVEKTDGSTVDINFSMQFDTTTGLIFSGNAIEADYIWYCTATSATACSGVNPASFIEYVSDENAASEFAFQIQKKLKGSIRIGNASHYITLLPAATFTSPVPTYTFEGDFFVDASKGTYCLLYTAVARLGINSYQTDSSAFSAVRCIYNSSQTALSPSYTGAASENNIYCFNIDKTFFDSPFHLRAVYNPNTEHSVEIYLNGELYMYVLRQTIYKFYLYYFERIVIGAGVSTDGSTVSASSTFFNIALSDFKFYTSPAVIPIPVQGNMLIRHNGANCYIPLTTNKANTSTPCLAVRHGNNNFYAIK